MNLLDDLLDKKMREKTMGLQKRLLKSKPVGKVTFRLPKEAAANAKTVNLVGEFNDWSETTLPMIRLKSGEFKLTIDLPVGRQYHFKYLISNPEGLSWENDWSADKYEPSGING